MQTGKQWDDTLENIVFSASFGLMKASPRGKRWNKTALCQHIIQARRFVRYVNTLNALRHFIQKMGLSHVCDMLDIIIHIYSCIFVDTFDVLYIECIFLQLCHNLLHVYWSWQTFSFLCLHVESYKAIRQCHTGWLPGGAKVASRGLKFGERLGWSK